jgi:hypothetical protein
MTSWRNFLGAIGLVPVILGICAAPAQAQNAQITGAVVDESGGIVPGVTVTARNQETGLVRTAVTDEGGAYRLPALPPGTYGLTVEIQGFNTVKRSDIVLVIGQTAILNFTLRAAGISETLTVIGAAPIVDTTRSDVTTSVSSQQIENLPLATRRWISFAMLTPGVSQDNIRNQYYPGTVNVGAGGREYSNAYVVDGVNNTWQEMGEPRQNFAMDSIREFKVSTSNFKAEYGLATGGLVEVVSKSGTNNLQGSGALFFRDKALTAKTYFEQEKPDYRRYQYAVSIGGPIVKDKTHFFVAYERTDETQFFTVSTRRIWPQYDGTYDSKQNRWNYTAKIDHQISRTQSAFLRYSRESEYRPIVNAGGRVAPTGAFDFSVPRDSAAAGYTWLISDRAINDFRFQYAYAEWQIAPPYTHLSRVIGDFSSNAFPAGACTERFIYPSVQAGGCQSSQGPETRWQFKDDFSYLTRDWGGTHQWKFGVDYNRILYQQDGIGNPGTWTFPTDRVYNSADPTTYPNQYTNSLPSYFPQPSNNFAAYVQDDWQPGAGIAFNLGLRWDVQRGVFNEDLDGLFKRIEEKLGPGHGYPLPIPFHADARKRGDWNNFGPRVGMAWDPGHSGQTNFHIAYGISYDNIRTLLNGAEISWPQGQPIVIVGSPSYPDPFQGRPRSQFISTAPPNIEVLANDMRNPRAGQFNVGMTRLLRPDLAVSTDFTLVRTYGDRIQPVDINMPDPVTRVRPYPQFNRVALDESSANHFYKALLVKIDKRLKDNYSLLVSYSLSKTDDSERLNAIGDLAAYTWPRLDHPATGDRRHRLVVSGTVQLPFQMQVSAIADFRTDLPFNPSTGLDLNRDGYAGGTYYTGDNPPGVAYNSGCRDLNVDAINAFRATRGLAAASSVACPGFANIDVRFSKLLRVVGSQRLELVVQLFNGLNRANFDVPASNPVSALFGQVIRLPAGINAPSRQAELAFRYSF